MKAARTNRWLMIAGLCWSAGACSDSSAPPAGQALPSGPEVVPAALAEEIPSHPIAARFWAEIDPLSTHIDYFPLHDGNVIYRNEVMSEIRYAFGTTQATQGSCTPGGSCSPSVGTVRLWTDQTKVTYVSGTGQCYQNGHGCVAPAAPCGSVHTYCAPVQMVSNVTWGNTVGALPDVILQIANVGGTANPITGCQDNGTNQFGLCKTTGSNKVDSSFSDLTSPIAGDGTTTFGCSYCYGNTSAIPAGVAGLKNALVSGLDPTLQAYNTDTLAMVLTNDSKLGLTITVRYSTPTFNTPASQITLRNGGTVVSCATPGTSTATLSGGAFGPPGACFTGTPPASCPSSGATAGTGYQVLFPRVGGGTVAGTIQVWSDTSVRAVVPANATGGQIQVVTPHGTNQTNDSFQACATPNSWRSLTSTITAVGAAGGVFGTNIVVAGGRADPTTSAGAVATTKIFALPTTATGNGSVSSGNSLTTARWGAAFTMAGGSLYVVGGTSDGFTCETTTEVLASYNGTWSTLAPTLPVGLCQATAVALGNYIIVSGGSTSPYADSLADFATTNANASYFLDTTNIAGGWTTATNSDAVDRFNAVASQAGTTGLIVGGGDFVGPTALSDVSTMTQAAGQPTYATSTVLPSALSLAAVAYAASKTKFYVYGGSASTDGTATGVTTLYSTSSTSPGAWTTLSPTGATPTARAGHLFLAATPSYMGATVKVYAIGGASAGNAITAIEEYYP